MKPLESIAFVLNAHRAKAPLLTKELVALAQARGVKTQITDRYPLPKGFLKGQDACCVVGGDGTLLSVVLEALTEQVPILGINVGKLGFLTTLSPEEARAQFVECLAGHYTETRRILLECRNSLGETVWALNDVVIKQACWERLLGLNVYCNGEWINRYASDGLIFTTPTGSTAYNLSANGPLIHPMAEVIGMTPICPHTLSNRTVIFPHHVRLKVECCDTEIQPQVAIDGKIKWDTASALPLTLSIAPKHLSLLQTKKYTYFDIVRSKLKWG